MFVITIIIYFVYQILRVYNYYSLKAFYYTNYTLALFFVYSMQIMQSRYIYLYCIWWLFYHWWDYWMIDYYTMNFHFLYLCVHTYIHFAPHGSLALFTFLIVFDLIYHIESFDIEIIYRIGISKIVVTSCKYHFLDIYIYIYYQCSELPLAFCSFTQ